ncbi:FMN-dependent dehydrogenase-domain-containing protein [Mrakia frigida]|uniref:FMN-dependent alpha-hydroxy acid dehydrogenase n=1 Tax=Mrakia frigida TaxID=29902 RepID=UPI003FCBFBE4
MSSLLTFSRSATSSARRTFASSTSSTPVLRMRARSSGSRFLFGTAALALPLGILLLSQAPINLDSSPSHPVKSSPSHQHGGHTITRKEVEKHTTKEDRLWVIIDEKVYDVTDFIDLHPGGQKIIMANAGKDATKLFKPIHPPATLEDNAELVHLVGTVPPLAEGEGMTDDEKRIAKARKALGHVDLNVNISDFEAACKDILTDKAMAYYSSGSDDEGTLASNKHSFSRILFKPRVLRKVKTVSTETNILGHKSSLPIYISPAALARLGSEDGEMNLARGAGETGIIQCISSNASCSLDEICGVRKEGQPLFWQYYVAADRPVAHESLKKAMSHDMNSIWVTVDAPVGGKREADLRVQLKENPPTDTPQQKGGSTSEQMFSYVDPELNWEDLKWIREESKGASLVIKGIGSVEDAVMAIEAGVDGLVLSNHGGRQLNGGVPPIRILQQLQAKHPELMKSTKTQIFLDGGITRGTDVLKALCLGATAVGLGRPFLYAQSGWGTQGVVKAVKIMEEEIQLSMRLLGVTSIDQLGPEYVEVLDM